MQVRIAKDFCALLKQDHQRNGNDMNPYDLSQMTLMLAKDEGAASAIDTMVEASLLMATGRIPDVGPAREALTAWDVTFETGEPISRMFGSTPALEVQLPAGWTISRRGGGGHHELLDARGASRLRWHIHGWDPISLSINDRFRILRTEDISATEAVLPICDGPTVIHTVHIRYPQARTNEPFQDGTPFYSTETTENYKAEEDARSEAVAWLDANRPLWRERLSSWAGA